MRRAFGGRNGLPYQAHGHTTSSACCTPKKMVIWAILTLAMFHVVYNIVAFVEAGPPDSVRNLLGWKPPPPPDLNKTVISQTLYHPAKGRPRRLLILQTSDGDSTYSKMLDVTQDANFQYAKLWGYGYWRWDGIAWGKEKWLATFNRIYLIDELYRSGEYQWVLFLDPGEHTTHPFSPS